LTKAAALAALLILGAGCTGDLPAQQQDAEAQGSSEGSPSCDASPATPPEGFLLVNSREFRYSDHVGVREDYRHEDGRLLVYLLGVTGEMGEGANVAEDLDLASGEPATLFGVEGGQNWSVVWEGELPCPQMAIVGNGFSREEFESTLQDMGVTSG
jgi:hypothetical protein